MAESIPSVEIESVTKLYGDIVAVDNMTLTITDGEFFSLLGPSGCGKTTTLRMIAGFELPTSGSVRISGQEMGETPPFKRPVNTVFQSYALFPHMTVAQNVAFGLEMRKVERGEIKQRVAEALEMVQLPQMAKRKPRQLSGGQRQRIALARALVNRPQVLLLDEPLGALDLKLRKAMQLELKALQVQVGITFVYVTHDQEEALTMSDRIAVMSEGRVHQIGAPRDIYERPTSRFVADFIGETNFMTGRVKASRSGEILVLVDGGLEMYVPTEQAMALESKVTVAIRPEKMSVHAEPPDPRAAPGVVEEVVYTGTDTRYLVQLTQHTIVTVRQQNVRADAGAIFPAGARVYLSWLPESARLLTA